MPPNESIARQDANSRFTLLGVSAVDGKTPVPIKVNPITGRVLIELFGGSFGDMTKLVYDANNNGKVDNAELADLATTFTETITQRKVSDAEKATWSGKQDALGFTPENVANKGIANGYTPLDATGKVASAYLPSFVDDVTEYANLAGFPGTGETGKMYVALDTNKVYRWSGSAYIEISGSPGSTDAVTEGATNLYFTIDRVLGTLLTGLSTATNAVITASDSVLSAMGKLQKQITDLGTSKANLASPTFTGTVSGITKAMVGLGSVDNTADSAKPVSTAQQTALNGKANISGGNSFTGIQALTGIGKLLIIGDDSALHDVNEANTVMLAGEQSNAIGIMKLGNTGAKIEGSSGTTKIDTYRPLLSVTGGVYKVEYMTQATYTALGTKDANTLYFTY